MLPVSGLEFFKTSIFTQQCQNLDNEQDCCMYSIYYTYKKNIHQCFTKSYGIA